MQKYKQKDLDLMLLLFFHISLIHFECEVHFYKNIDVRLTEKTLVFLFFYCCTVHFDNTEILITNKCTPLLHIKC